MNTLTNPMRVVLADEAATARLAAALARLVCAGDVLRLEGPMGAGKTTLVQHIVRALGWVAEVPSPTYTLLQTYRTARFHVAHLDCYRLTSPTELVPLGIETFRQFGVVIAEWPARGGALLAADTPDLLTYHINSIENPGVLTITLSGAGSGPRVAELYGSPSWQRRLSLLTGLGVVPEGTQNTLRNEGSRTRFLQGLGLDYFTLQSQSGDWSGRSYARVKLADGTTRMLMDAPPPIESVTEYAQVAEYYRSIGLCAAQVYGRDDANGFLLTDDFGDTTLHAAMQQGPQTPWFKVAAHMLAVQCQAKPPAWARNYTRTDWWVEAIRFTNWYMPFATGEATALEDYARWQALMLPLYEIVNATPRGLMMWDCQSPNLMLCGAEPVLNHLAIIDHQDARIAPVGQDAGLLVRNIRTPRHDADEEAVVAELVTRLGVDELLLRRSLAIGSFHHMIRILGGLTRLAVRDGRPAPAQNYLARTWEVAEQCALDPCIKNDLAPVWAFMHPYREIGLARLKQDFAA
jgi:tRNA threonylcarbamoyl adenosine modification protein YjeE